jgi:hypothetical protein
VPPLLLSRRQNLPKQTPFNAGLMELAPVIAQKILGADQFGQNQHRVHPWSGFCSTLNISHQQPKLQPRNRWKKLENSGDLQRLLLAGLRQWMPEHYVRKNR